MKVLIFKVLAESHAYSYFANSLCRALEELGHEAAVSDQFVHAVNDTVDLSHLVGELQANHYDVVVSFNSFLGSVSASNGDSLFDLLDVKFLGWQLDHPIYAPHSLTRQLRGRYSIFPNPNHLRFAEAINAPARARTMLPGIEPLAEPIKPHRSRDWSIFVAATWNGRPTPLWEQLPDSPARSLLMGVVDRLLADREASLLDAFDETCTDLKLGAKLGVDPAFDDQMISFLRDPLTYFRHVDRIRIIQSLADSGLPLTICGQGWRDYLGERSNVVFLDKRVGTQDLPRLYNNARVVLNLNAGNGACERALQAASAGALVLSDYSEALAQSFGGLDACAFFNRARPDDVAEVAQSLLEADRGEDMAQQGHARILDSGLWRHRAGELVEFLNGA